MMKCLVWNCAPDSSRDAAFGYSTHEHNLNSKAKAIDKRGTVIPAVLTQ